MNFNPMKHRIPFIKRWLPSARKAWARVFWPAGYKIVRTGPIHMLVNWNNFIDRQIAFYDDYEAAQWACMEKHLRALSPVDLFIDVGANIGFYSLRIAK
ncbi:MAG: hypothetical protein U9N14_05630, partial [Pseudomonadota bacterium]|nr:hypothetical protein [Pseudomonadota bacterium]